MFFSEIVADSKSKNELNIIQFLVNSEPSLALDTCFSCEEAIFDKKEGLTYIHHTINFLNAFVETGSY